MKVRFALRSFAAVSAGVMLVFAATRCGHVTELVVSADGDLDTDEITVSIDSDGTHEDRPPGRSLPATLGVSTDTPGRHVSITVVAKKNGVEIARRTRSTGFVEGERRLVAIPLCRSCSAVTCLAGQECAEGVCVATDIPSAALPRLDGDPPRLSCVPGKDGGTTGGDGSAADEGAQLFASPAPGAVGRRLFSFSGALYWQWDLNGRSTISSLRVAASGGGDSGVPLTLAASGARQDVFTPNGLVPHFKVESAGRFAVMQAADGTALVIDDRGDKTSPASAPPLCTDLDVSYRTEQAFCRTPGPNGTVVRWPIANGAPVAVASDLPPGDEIVAATSSRTNEKFLLYPDDVGTIWSRDIDTLVADGGGPPAKTFATGQPGAMQLWSTPDDSWWMTSDNGRQAIKWKDARSDGNVIELVAREGLGAMVVTPATVLFAARMPGDAGRSSIESVPARTGGQSPTVIRANVATPVALATYSAFVIWLTQDAELRWAALL